MKKLILSLVLTGWMGGIAFGQLTGKIAGTVTDGSTGEGLPFANIVLYQNGVQKGGAPTDFDGSFSIAPLNPGTYDVKIQYQGYNSKEIRDFVVRAGATERINVTLMEQVTETEVIEVVIHEKDLISQDKTTSGQVLTSKEIQAMPTRDIATMANMGAGTYSADDGGSINIGGSRSSNTVTYINGVKVIGNIDLPPAAIDQMQVMMRGIPAQFGDVTGGVINITTRGAASNFFGTVNAETSNMFDKWNQNVVNLTLAGPILADTARDGNGDPIKDANGKVMKDTRLGYFASVQYEDFKDSRPSGVPIYQVKDSLFDDILQYPLYRDASGAYKYRADLLEKDDLYTVKVRPNTQRQKIQGSVSLDFVPNQNTTITFGGSYNYSKRYGYGQDGGSGYGQSYIRQYSLLNYNSNPELIDNNYNIFARLRQNIGGNSSSDSSASAITNAYYQVQFDYSKAKRVVQDPNHKKNWMRYGHVGYFDQEFESVKLAPGEPGSMNNYLEVHDNLGDASSDFDVTGFGFYYTGTDVMQIIGTDSTGAPISELIGTGDATELLNGTYYQYSKQSVDVAYTPSEYNPLASNYLSHYYQLVEESGNTVESLDQILTQGLYYNGQRSNLINGLYYANGRAYNGYSIQDQDQFRLSALAAAEINKKHTVTFGFEYEQRDFRRFSVSPLDLWAVANARVNEQFKGYDYSNASGSELVNGSYFYDFNQVVNDTFQSDFDVALRQKFGYDDQELIELFTLNPDDIQELLPNIAARNYWNSGVINYSGYDKNGDRIKNSNYSFQDFFLDSINAPQRSFTPNYAAFFVEDKFEIEDLIIRVGLRVDRYDANQQKLKDRYSTVDLSLVGETDLDKFSNSSDINNESGVIQDDWAIIVDQSAESYDGTALSQSKYNVLGFRDGTTLYDLQGNEVPSSFYLAPNGEKLNQWFDASDLTGDDLELYKSRKISLQAFEDFKPQYNFMPRIAFSFPISEDAGFYAHYDVLTQRPDFNLTSTLPSSFYYLSQGAGFMNNADLKPERKINYQLGFQQKLGQYSALKIEAYYNEMRDQIGLIRVQNAYPTDYTTYGNVDNGTSRGLTFTYDLRKKKNLSGYFSYTLAYADGTGSSASTSINLINAGYGNLKFPTPLSFDQRHAFKANADYRIGNVTKEGGKKSIFANSGANFTIIAGSGVPYTRYSSRQTEILLGVAGQTKLDGSINGSRLPWNFRANLKLDKDFVIRKGGEGKDEKIINIYFYVQNLFNNKNILNVYKNTGEVDDDGYLATSAVDGWTQSQKDLYEIALINPNWISLPRRARLGLTYSF